MDDRTIDRANLESQVTEPNSPDPALESFYRQQLQQLYADPSHGGNESDIAAGADAEHTKDSEANDYEFHLFTRPSTLGLASVGTSNAPQRITLRSPSPAVGGSGFKNGGRPDSYYFTGPTGPELAKQYTQAAISGQDVIDDLKRSWKGMELPWRVTVIKTTDAGNSMGFKHQSEAQTNRRRKRSGMKRRIVIRRRVEARTAREVMARQNQAEKEAAEREKRSRRNREKKVKRRQKDKLKKLNDGQDPV